MEREVFVIAEVCKNIRTSLKVNGKRSEEFKMKALIHQVSVVLFAVVMGEIAKM